MLRTALAGNERMPVVIRMRWIGLSLILVSCGVSVLWGFLGGRSAGGRSVDLQVIYYGARCLMEHHNPYSQSDVESVYRAAGGESATEDSRHHQIVTTIENLPTTLLLAVPLAMLPYGAAQMLWLILTALVLALAACLIWDVSARSAPRLSLFLICLLAANSEILFMTGNSAGLAVSLCTIAAWCFLEDRSAMAGIACLSISLAVKPHDAGLVWLFFLLAGGVWRKRALQTLAVTATIALVAAAWTTLVAPHWVADWRSNLATLSAAGGLDDPRVVSLTGRRAGQVIDLQGAFSIVVDNSHADNLLTYLVVGTLLLVWSIRTLRVRFSQWGAWLALSTVVPLTLILTYHRTYDARLLLLTVPGCAMLWSRGGPKAWCAALVSVAGITLTADIPLTVLAVLTQSWHAATGILGRLLTAAILRPTPLVLLAMGVYYLCVYVRSDRTPDSTRNSEEPKAAMSPSTPA